MKFDAAIPLIKLLIQYIVYPLRYVTLPLSQSASELSDYWPTIAVSLTLMNQIFRASSDEDIAHIVTTTVGISDCCKAVGFIFQLFVVIEGTIMNDTTL